MDAAMIKDNEVLNIIVAEECVYEELEQALGVKLVNVDNIPCDIGWITDNEGLTFHPKIVQEEEE